MILKESGVWTYPSGRVRLKGKPLADLRVACYERDDQKCRRCGIPVVFNARFAGDPIAYDMAHIVSRGAGGSDALDNVQAECHRCHMRAHNGGK